MSTALATVSEQFWAALLRADPRELYQAAAEAGLIAPAVVVGTSEKYVSPDTPTSIRMETAAGG